MAITAALVKELRERTGAGMMDCKKALQESNGDIEAAIEAMRKSGQAKAAKKAGRIAAEGLIVIHQNGNQAVMLEVNSETDFVAKADEFNAFCKEVADTALKNQPEGLDALFSLSLASSGKNIEDSRKDLVAKIGENIQIRRFVLLNSDNGLGAYLHGTRIGVVVDMQGGGPELARDIAMHIAASRPFCVNAEQVPQAMLDKEKEIFSAQAQESGKPPEIIEKMVVGRIKKYLGEITLLGQPFVKDPDQTIEKLLKAHNAKVNHFERYEVGEGIEKKTENFAEEVMKQAQGTA